MTPQEMEKELQAGKIRPVYYLYGENRLGMDHMLESIRGALLYSGASRGSTGEITLYGGEVKADELVVTANTFPMLAGRRMIMVKAAHEIPKTEMRSLALYMENPADCASIFFKENYRSI